MVSPGSVDPLDQLSRGVVTVGERTAVVVRLRGDPSGAVVPVGPALADSVGDTPQPQFGVVLVALEAPVLALPQRAEVEVSVRVARATAVRGAVLQRISLGVVGPVLRRPVGKVTPGDAPFRGPADPGGLPERVGEFDDAAPRVAYERTGGTQRVRLSDDKTRVIVDESALADAQGVDDAGERSVAIEREGRGAAQRIDDRDTVAPCRRRPTPMCCRPVAPPSSHGRARRTPCAPLRRRDG